MKDESGKKIQLRKQINLKEIIMKRMGTKFF